MSNKEDMAWKHAIMAYALLIPGVLFPSLAFAYVDPGSGSVIVTTVLGFIAAIGYTFRKYFYKIKRAMFRKKAKIEKDESDSET